MAILETDLCNQWSGRDPGLRLPSDRDYARRLGLHHGIIGAAVQAWACLDWACVSSFRLVAFDRLGQLLSANDYNLSVIHAGA